jgi:hypothetical protein
VGKFSKESALFLQVAYARLCMSEVQPHTVETATIEHMMSIATFVNIIFFLSLFFNRGLLSITALA